MTKAHERRFILRLIAAIALICIVMALIYNDYEIAFTIGLGAAYILLDRDSKVSDEENRL